MTLKMPDQIISFAGEANIGIYKMFADYYNHYLSLNGKENVEFQTTVTEEGIEKPITFSEKEEKMNAALKREIMRVAGVPSLDLVPLETWANHPSLKWASFAVISAMIDVVFPVSIIDSIGAFTEVRTIGWGDSASFTVGSRDLFVVSKAGRAKRITELHKDFVGQITVVPELREMTVFVNLMNVLSGRESLAPLVTKMVRSFEVALSQDVYTAIGTAMTALDNTAATGLRVAGYTQDEFIRLSQTVSAWNGGARAVAIGTQLALSKILPANANYRWDLSGDYVKLGYIPNFMGTDLLVLPQIADWTTPFGTLLDNSKIWIISPSSDKIIKVVLEGSALSYTSDRYAYANLIQTSTLIKSWGSAVATSSVGAQINL